MLIARIFDNLLLQIGNLGQTLPFIIQIIITLGWIFLIRKFKIKYQSILSISLVLIFLAVVTMIFTLSSIAKVIGEYAFIFLGIGILQIVFTKNEKNHPEKNK